MLLRDLTIENYRSFDKYRLDNLARVNLLVGDNNCGKTSVLEAAFLLAAEGHFAVLHHILVVREDCSYGPASAGPSSNLLVHADSIFHKDITRQPQNDHQASLKIKGVRGSLPDSTPLELEYSVGPSKQTTTTPAPWSVNGRESLLRMRYQKGSESLDGEAELDRLGRMAATATVNRGFSPSARPALFIPWKGLTTPQIAMIWKSLLPSRREQYAVESMRIIDSSVVDIIPSPDMQNLRDIYVDIGAKRVPMSQLGGGALNMMSIGCGLGFATNSGFLFIDEIDTGLHYSRLPDMWRMVIQSAKDLDVQVFATTHSLDCIRGLAAAVRDDESFVDDVAIFK
ncbi:MAG: AAA family ATPase, partial [Planctomycetaceae bacterium]|nr:AAA family ATPase [Planctomycetaceae bacterium]